MLFNSLFRYPKIGNVLTSKATQPPFKLLAILIVALFLGLPTTVYAAEVTYEGEGSGLQTTPGWFWFSGTINSLFPGTETEPLSSDNSVTVDFQVGGAMTNPQYVFGGLSELENATNNNVTILDGHVNFEVFGGWSYDGNAINNALTISGGEVDQHVYGGYSELGIAENNSVKISGGQVGLSVYGGKSGLWDAIHNAVTVSGGDVGLYVIGGWSGSGSAKYNAVTINGGKVGQSVFGGESNAGNAINNTVTISDGDVGKYVVGGYSRYGITENNSVNISGGEVGESVLGGESPYGDAEYNSVTISSGDVGGYVIGGWSELGIAKNNTVTISGGEVGQAVLGGESDQGEAINNAVTVSGGYVNNFVSGGYSYDGNAEYNTVTISGGEVGQTVLGGESYNGEAINNAVTVSSGKVTYDIMGGFSYDGNAEYNTVTISGGEVGQAVLGGESHNGEAINNAVTVSSGKVTYDIMGGLSYDGNAEYNTVTISGGEVGQHVYGGLSAFGNTTYNTITIEGSPILTTAVIFGGHGYSSGDYFTGNTLNFKSSGIAIAGVGNFEYYNFYLPTGTEANDTMLSVSTGVDLDNATVEIYLQGSNSLQAGDKVSLISSASGVSNYTISNSQASLGAFITYDFDIYADTDDLWAELTSVKASSGNKALTNSRTAPLAFLNQGADLAASLEHLEVSGNSRYTAFAIVGGGSSTYDTGSDVDVKGVSVLAGVTWDAPIKKNRLTLSAFIEAGWGSYDTDNSFGGTSLKGSGDTDYYGGGLYARHNWDSGIYADASLRVGHMSTDFDSSDIAVSGSSLRYDSGSKYYGAHAGLGYVWQLSGKNRLELSGKYLWTRLDSDELTASSGDRISFDSANSSRFRAGFRMYHDYGNANAVTLYYGAAYEYEFDGDADGRLYGAYALDRSSLSGGSGIGELGVMFRPSKDNDRLTMQLGLQGYIGAREGISGVLKAQYAF